MSECVRIRIYCSECKARRGSSAQDSSAPLHNSCDCESACCEARRAAAAAGAECEVRHANRAEPTVDAAHALLVETGEQHCVGHLSQIELLGHAIEVQSRERQIDLIVTSANTARVSTSAASPSLKLRFENNSLVILNKIICMYKVIV